MCSTVLFLLFFWTFFLMCFLFLPTIYIYSYLFFLPSGAIKSWQQTVNRRSFGHGIEMTWWRKWLSPWLQRAWGPSALHTEISLPLKVNLTGTMKMISFLDWPASVWWALKTPWDQRLVASAYWCEVVSEMRDCFGEKMNVEEVFLTFCKVKQLHASRLYACPALSSAPCNVPATWP